MGRCRNCGVFVSTGYVRVFTPSGVTAPPVCPACEDAVSGDAGESSSGAG